MQEAGPSRPTTSTRPRGPATARGLRHHAYAPTTTGHGPATARGLRAVHLDCVHALRVPDLSASVLAGNKYRSREQ